MIVLTVVMWYSKIVIPSKYHNSSPLYLLGDIAICYSSIKGSYSASGSSTEMHVSYLQAATTGIQILNCEPFYIQGKNISTHIPYIVCGITGGLFYAKC